MPKSRDKNWKAPHKPLRGAACEFGHIGEILTDRRIRFYILQGRYGDDAKATLLAQKVQKKRTPPSPSLTLALDVLGL